MGQKVSPTCLRLSLNRRWKSRWFVPDKRQFAAYLNEDRQVRELLKKELESAAVGRIDIERSPDRIRIIIYTARPGVLIGRRGENIQRLQDRIQKIVTTQKQLKLDYVEISNPYTDAQLVAESISFQMEKRVAFRRAMKRAIQQGMDSGAKGIKIICAGRLGGAEMKRTETYRDGKIPLGTLRSDIEFGTATAHTTAGCVGTKVWIYKGDVVPMKPVDVTPSAQPGHQPVERELAPVAQPVN